MRPWRCDATKDKIADPGADWFRVRELRQAHRHSIDPQARNKTGQTRAKSQATHQESGAGTPALAASLTLRSLRFLRREFFPRQSASCNLRANQREPLRIIHI